jgi:hypothetical protein
MEIAAGNTQQVALRNLEGRYQVASGDRYTGAHGAINVEHMMVHAGRFFTAADIDEAVAPGSPKQWLFITPDVDTMEFHLQIAVTASKQSRIELFEGAEVSALGDAIEPVNHKRYSGYESQLAVHEDPTVDDEGDRIDVASVGTTGGNVRIGGVARSGAEWDLKPNTIYLLKVTAGAADDVVSMAAEYYEFDEDEAVFEDVPLSSSSSA